MRVTIPPVPQVGKGLGSEEAIWFKRLEDKKNPQHSEIRNFIVASNTGLAISFAKKFIEKLGAKGNISIADQVLSDMNLMLIRAVDSYKLSHGVRFSTFAHKVMFHRGTKIFKGIVTSRMSPVSIDRISLPDNTQADRRELSEDLEQLEAAMLTAGLTNQEKIVLDMRFRQHLTLEESGNKLNGLSKERIRQIEIQAIQKLRKEML